MTASAPPSPPSTVLRINTQAPYYKWLVVGIIMLSTLTQTFAGNSVNLAIPRLMAAFGTDLGTAQWVTTGFLITRALIVPILGWLGGGAGEPQSVCALHDGICDRICRMWLGNQSVDVSRVSPHARFCHGPDGGTLRYLLATGLPAASAWPGAWFPLFPANGW